MCSAPNPSLLSFIFVSLFPPPSILPSFLPSLPPSLFLVGREEEGNTVALLAILLSLLLPSSLLLLLSFTLSVLHITIFSPMYPLFHQGSLTGDQSLDSGGQSAVGEGGEEKPAHGTAFMEAIEMTTAGQGCKYVYCSGCN